MPIEAGTPLGPYEVVAQIGAGGMGEVYRARDPKLERDVAIKVLPEAFAADKERLARFEREAKSLAALNHPNIATIYGFEADGETRFLVMELVEGENLADRIRRGPIPVDEAIELFKQIAAGLEAAHEKGVIHRDLKPANIQLTDDGSAKILDFGLAKALTDEGEGADPKLSHSPTLTLEATLQGQILGTAAYMAPEQAAGKAVDARADVWALGASLFEALSGRRAFPGNSSPEVLAKVLEREPQWSALPEGLPPALVRLLERSLEKDSRRRLRHIGDARLELEAAQEEVAAPSGASAVESRLRLSPSIGLSLLALGVAAGAVAGWLRWGDSSQSPTGAAAPQFRSSIEVPAESPLATPSDMTYAIARRSLAISPDGRRVVYVAVVDGVRKLVLRELDSFEHTILEGTENATSPFFKPDGSWIGFFTNDRLMKVPVLGGVPVALCEAGTSGIGTWSDDGWIYFIHHEVVLAKVEEGGGSPVNLAPGVTAATPSSLPEGRGVLVSSRDWASISWDTAELTFVTPEGELRELGINGYSPHYVPTGHLVFMRSGELMTVPFDLGRQSPVGTPVSVLAGVATDSISPVSQYSLSREGTLAFVEGGDWARTTMSWVDRDGRVDPLASLPTAVHGQPSLSPDGERVAVPVIAQQDDIYVYDLRRGTFERLTLDGGDGFPVWSPDGREVIYGSITAEEGRTMLYRQPVGRRGTPEVLSGGVDAVAQTARVSYLPTSVSPDGEHLLFVSQHPTQGLDVLVLQLDGGTPEPFAATENSEVNGHFSPDGRWVAYLSDQTGRHEVYVRSFFGEEREWQVSSGGGDDPRWSPQGTELFYRKGPDLMSVSFTPEPDFEPQTPRLILRTDFLNVPGMSFDISPDGRRFLVLRPLEADAPPRGLRVVTRWFEELERLVPVD